LRIVSLLPSATETVCALGARDMLVGVSHECDFPPAVQGLPVLTRPRYGVPPSADAAAYAQALARAGRSHSAAIDATIRDIRLDALSPYLLDRDLLARLRPDVVFTQDLCAVCAPSFDEVRAAALELCGPQTRVVSLTPQRLGDIWGDIRRAGAALGLDDAANRLVTSLRARLDTVAQRCRAGRAPQRNVLTVEWFDPLMNGGLWMPELVELAGGIEYDGHDPASGQPVAAQPGVKSRVLDRDELGAMAPEVVVLKPCGFNLAEGQHELPALIYSTPWSAWPAVARGEVYLMDGSAYFNRPGPRIAESGELLAAALHPALFPDIRARHRQEVLRIGPQLEAQWW
jgi:iron complex transport system substrate-binding protein